MRIAQLGVDRVKAVMAKRPLLISVHVPKASGMSVGRALRDYYREEFLADYADDPADPSSQGVFDPDRHLRSKLSPPAGIACIHGHLHPGKYDIPSDAVLFTMLRHPVDNLLSIFFFWRRLGRGHGGALHTYFLDHDLTILQTARLPLIRWLYSQTYFGGFDMARFDLVGRYADREAVLARLMERIGVALELTIRENVTPLCEERQAAMGDSQLRGALENILADDIHFYERYAR